MYIYINISILDNIYSLREYESMLIHIILTIHIQLTINK